MVAKESTVAEWESHFQANPGQTLPEYKADWTTIRNNAEGTGVDVAIGTVRRYLEIFRESNSLDRLGTQLADLKDAQVESVESDPVAALLMLESELGSLTITAEKYLGQCKYIAAVITTTLSLLQENRVWSDLQSKAEKLENELGLAQSQVESLKVEADAQKELRVRAANKTVYGS